MTSRPYVLLSCAASIDGYIDDTTASRLLLSNDTDFDRVDEVRVGCDAILVGAAAIRKDNPRLLVRSRARQDARTARGTTPTPVKVTITGHGDLDPAAKFFAAGDTAKIVYAASPALDKARERVGAVATVIDAGNPADLHRVLDDLHARGIGRLMVEGGGTTHTQVPGRGTGRRAAPGHRPFFVGDARAPRFVNDGTFPWNPGHRARLADVTQIDDVVLLRYALSDRYDGH
ncbi:MAG: RibD family protein [Streptosporangiaceae bacterium]